MKNRTKTRFQPTMEDEEILTVVKELRWIEATLCHASITPDRLLHAKIDHLEKILIGEGVMNAEGQFINSGKKELDEAIDRILNEE